MLGSAIEETRHGGPCARYGQQRPPAGGGGAGGRGCRCALTADCEAAEASGNERQLGWYAAGQHIALDVARGLHFLHKSGVRCPPRTFVCILALILGALLAVCQKKQGR